MDNKTLISKLALQLDRSPEAVESNLNALGEVLIECLQNGDSVSLPGFGTFEPKLKMERLAVHPASGKKLLVPPKLTVAFKPSVILKQRVRK